MYVACSQTLSGDNEHSTNKLTHRPTCTPGATDHDNDIMWHHRTPDLWCVWAKRTEQSGRCGGVQRQLHGRASAGDLSCSGAERLQRATEGAAALTNERADERTNKQTHKPSSHHVAVTAAPAPPAARVVVNAPSPIARSLSHADTVLGFFLRLCTGSRSSIVKL